MIISVPISRLAFKMWLGMAIILGCLVGFGAAPAIYSSIDCATTPRVVYLENVRQNQAALNVAAVFGRSQGCRKMDAPFISLVAKTALETNLDPSIAAAVVATESSCQQFAVSSKGAVGYMQIMVKTWHEQYGLGKETNPFRAPDNLRVGMSILSELIAKNGVEGGLLGYNGLGTGCTTCDGAYVSKITKLAKGE